MKDINMRTVLEECLEWKRDLKRLCSEKYDGQNPAHGMEEEFDAEEKKCQILMKLLQAIQNEKVRIAIANWDKDGLKLWQQMTMAGQMTTKDISKEAFEDVIKATGEEQMRF